MGTLMRWIGQGIVSVVITAVIVAVSLGIANASVLPAMIGAALLALGLVGGPLVFLIVFAALELRHARQARTSGAGSSAQVTAHARTR